MSNPAQKRAIKNYRRRLQKRGAARFEVLGLNAFTASFGKGITGAK